jgi:hypothetical protein
MIIRTGQPKFSAQGLTSSGEPILVEVGYNSVNAVGHGIHKQKYPLPEINAQYLRGWVLIRHVDGPYTRTRSHVKDAVWIAHYGCFMQLPFHHLQHDLVVKVHPILLSL